MIRKTVEPRFDPATGLLPAVVQAPDGRVLMLGYMSRRALARTLEDGRVTFHSRRRRGLWVKGETSGHWLEPLELRLDCDGDALLVLARPHGPTCHAGAESCFDAGAALSSSSRASDPRSPAAADPAAAPAPEPADPRSSAAVHPAAAPAPEPGDPTAADVPELATALNDLIEVVAERDRARPAGSYTADLLAAGPQRVAKKVGEEAVEAALAANDPAELAAESADLLYHLVVLWRAAGLDPAAVAAELAARRGAVGRDTAKDAESGRKKEERHPDP
ncbi:MAG: phosphoribosyl-ATP diphosphatase [Gemmatimonadota bacterium]